MKEASHVEEVDVPHVPHYEAERDGHGEPGGAGGGFDQVEHVARPTEEENARPGHPDEERNRFLRLKTTLNFLELEFLTLQGDPSPRGPGLG